MIPVSYYERTQRALNGLNLEITRRTFLGLQDPINGGARLKIRKNIEKDCGQISATLRVRCPDEVNCRSM